jgi:hypothetical protein
MKFIVVLVLADTYKHFGRTISLLKYCNVKMEILVSLETEYVMLPLTRR